jgi:hypothetical protein
MRSMPTPNDEDIARLRLPPQPHRDFAFYEENAHAAGGNVLTIQTRLLFAYHTCA